MCGCLLHIRNGGLSLQPRHVPWLGLKSVTLWSTARTQSTESHQPGLLRVLYLPLLVAPNLSCVPIAGDSFKIWRPNSVTLLLRVGVRVPSPWIWVNLWLSWPIWHWVTSQAWRPESPCKNLTTLEFGRWWGSFFLDVLPERWEE